MNIFIYAVCTVVQCVQSLRLLITRSKFFSPDTQPDLIRRYDCAPFLRNNRIFKPKNITPDQRLPLVLDVHGGGFIISNPSDEDPLCRYLADACQCIVVCLDYRKAPQHSFPAGLEDIIALIPAVIQDPDLNIDPTRVVLCGSSAGGGLVFSACQDPRVRNMAAAIIGIYPMLDCKTSRDDKLASRPDKTVTDLLKYSHDPVVKAYVQSNPVSLDDVRVSPIYFADRSAIPKKAYLCGVEHDMLCNEARVMAEKLAGEADRTFTVSGWKTEDVEWDLIKGQVHAFDRNRQWGAKEKLRVTATEKLCARLAKWLTDEIFADTTTT